MVYIRKGKKRFLHSIKEKNKIKKGDIYYYFWIYSNKPPYYPSYGYIEKQQYYESKELAFFTYLLLIIIINTLFIPIIILLNGSISNYNLFIIWIIYFISSYIFSFSWMIILLYLPPFYKIVYILCR